METESCCQSETPSGGCCCQPCQPKKPLSDAKFFTMWACLAVMFLVGCITFYNWQMAKLMFENGYSEVYVPYGSHVKVIQKK